MRNVLIICVSLGLLVLGILFGPGVYKKWRSERAFHNAEAALGRNREKEALLSLQEALQSDPENLPATRLMSSLLEKRHSPASILWHRRLSQLAPSEAEPRLAWLREALSLHDSAMARAALESFPENQQQSAIFQHLASSEALLRKDWAQAEFHAAEALRLDPGNPVLQLNLASVGLQSSDAPTVARSRTMLIGMQRQENLSVAATRVLITDAIRREDFQKAADLSRILIPSSSSNFEDRMQFLTALDGLSSPETNTELKNLEQEAGHDLAKDIRLVEWMSLHHRGEEALAFIQQLPPSSLEDLAIRVLRASAEASRGEWPVLQHRLQAEFWDENDYFRQAFLARALKETRQDSGARNEWSSACKGAAKSPQGLYLLASSVLTWPHWEDETVDLMWMIADGYRYPFWALSQLHSYYLAKGDTRSLYRVAKRWREIQTTDPVLNNFIQYSLLLNQDVTQVTALARENFNRHPGDPGYLSTYAFALNQSEKSKEALDLMAQLKPEQWKSPELCAYQAIFLAKAGHQEEAARFKKQAVGASLLPEEKALLEKAAPN